MSEMEPEFFTLPRKRDLLFRCQSLKDLIEFVSKLYGGICK